MSAVGPTRQVRTRWALAVYVALVAMLLAAIGIVTTSVPTDAMVYEDVLVSGAPGATVRNALAEARVVNVTTARVIVDPTASLDDGEARLTTPATWLVITVDVTNLRTSGFRVYNLVDGAGVVYEEPISPSGPDSISEPIPLVQQREQVAFEVSPRRLEGSRLRIKAGDGITSTRLTLDIDLGIDAALARRLQHARSTIVLKQADPHARSRMVGGGR